MDKRSIFGRWGETQAMAYLKRKGYGLVTQNYSCPQGEIDLIMTRGNQLTFIEVKARKSLNFGRPAEAVTKTKQDKIKSTALHFLQTSDIRYSRISFDVVEVYYANSQLVINHIPHCF